MKTEYDPSTIETKWQRKWEETKMYETDLHKTKNPYYSLVMFPYPSGDRLHVGHWYAYAPPDSYARYQRMCGKGVFEPFGFDAFGLPAENFAIKTGTPPAVSTEENVQTMIKQLKRMGCMYDWSKSVNTSTPEYYRWTQWLFLQMYEHDLAYRKNAAVNYCPDCKTVLANEQAQDGRCERCGNEVIQKPLTQWFWKITDYAEKLLEGLEEIDWPEKTKIMQTNWIGKKSGINITYEVKGRVRGVVGPINWSEIDAKLAGDLNRRLTVDAQCDAGTVDAQCGTLTGDFNRRLTDESRRRIHSPRTVHLTFTPYKRMEVFEDPHHATIMLRILKEVADRHEIILHEVAVMPDHVHLLVTYESNRHLERDIMKKLKGASSRAFRDHIECDVSHLWGEKKHFEDVESAEQFLTVLKYIQKNPLQVGLAQDGRVLSRLSEIITCFTTRPDTNFGATFVVLAPEHPFSQQVAEDNAEVAAYIKAALNKTELERQEEGTKKTGAFTGYVAINTLNGREMPIWVSDFVLGGFGTGAVVGVPGHDVRDFEFAQEYDLPVIRVVVASDGDASEITSIDQVQEAEGTMVNSEFLDGLDIHTATQKMMDYMEEQGYGERITTYRLRDWLISRQRYWGAPIPIVYDPDGNPHPIPEEHLPWLLPEDVEFKPTGTSPLAESKELKERVEKIFGKGWEPEYDTMDTFVCSSFYQLMYLSIEGVGVNAECRMKNAAFINPDIEKKWMPVDMYIGGPEHACMHLIYARFVMMALKDFGFVKSEEPFKKLVHQGMITNQGAKMSKSKGNTVSPDDFVEKYGSDVFRMYLMFMGPYAEGGDWSDTGIKGIDRFVKRVWKVLTTKCASSSKKVEQNSALTAGLHATIKRVTEDIGRLHFNTAISALMEFLNQLDAQEEIAVETAQIFTKLLAPLAPHLAEELWGQLGGSEFVINQSWPQYDVALIKTDTVTIAVQVNGKVRGELTVSADITDQDVITQSKAVENVAKHLEGKEIKKEIYIEGKLVSFVV